MQVSTEYERYYKNHITPVKKKEKKKKKFEPFILAVTFTAAITKVVGWQIPDQIMWAKS